MADKARARFTSRDWRGRGFLAYCANASLANGRDHQPNRTPKPEREEQRHSPRGSQCHAWANGAAGAAGVLRSSLRARLWAIFHRILYGAREARPIGPIPDLVGPLVQVLYDWHGQVSYLPPSGRRSIKP